MFCKIATLLLLELIWTLLIFVYKGAIELSILSEYYGREIAAYDIQTSRCDLYGQVSDLSSPYLLVPNLLIYLSVLHFLTQEKNYSERAMLIYDGLHYDALAVSSLDGITLIINKTQEVFANYIYFFWTKIQMSPAEGAPEEFDQTIFPVNHNRSIGPAEGLALNLVKEAQRYLTIASWTLCSLPVNFPVDDNIAHLFCLTCNMQEEELYWHRELHSALWSVPDRRHRSKGKGSYKMQKVSTSNQICKKSLYWMFQSVCAQCRRPSNMRKPLAMSTSKNTNDSSTRLDCSVVNLTIILVPIDILPLLDMVGTTLYHNVILTGKQNNGHLGCG